MNKSKLKNNTISILDLSEFIPDEKIKVRKVLYKLNSKKKIQLWIGEIKILQLSTGAIMDFNKIIQDQQYDFIPLIVTSSGEENGKMREPHIIKIEETKRGYPTIFDYVHEAFRQEVYKHVDREGYFESREIAERNDVFTPMLAASFDDIKNIKKFKFSDFFIQPKIDGERCIIQYNEKEKNFSFISRKNKFFTGLDHLNEQLLKVPEFCRSNIKLDGELFADGFDLQKIHSIASKRVKLSKVDIENKKKLIVYLFDIIDMNNLDWKGLDRYNELKAIFLKNSDKLSKFRLIDSIMPVKNIDELNVIHKQIVEDGFEGIILRNVDAPYMIGKRSNKAILKKKFKFEKDYPISGFKLETVDERSGAIQWLCKTEDGKEFTVLPEGVSIEDRIRVGKEALDNFDKFEGRLLQVYYYSFTSDKKPRNATSSLYPKID